MTRRRSVGVLGFLSVAFALTACAPPGAAPTLLEITTIQTMCGGAFHPDQPPCRSNPASRAIEVEVHGTVVASGTTDATGHVLLDVPAGTLVVSVPGALPYMNCDTPSVIAVAGATTPVTQTCTLLLP